MPPQPTTSAVATVLDDLPFHLARATLAFRRFNDRTLRALGLPSQAPGIGSVLHALDEQDACTVNNLVERTHLPNGTLTGLLDRLERDRCIKRTRNEDDGRSWLIRLTPKGRQVCVRLRERHQVVMTFFAKTLSPGETAELKTLLARTTERMRAYGAADVSTGSVPAPRRSARRVASSPPVKTKSRTRQKMPAAVRADRT